MTTKELRSTFSELLGVRRLDQSKLTHIKGREWGRPSGPIEGRIRALAKGGNRHRATKLKKGRTVRPDPSNNDHVSEGFF